MFNYDIDSFWENKHSLRFFSGGGGPKLKTPEKPAKQQEVRRIEESAGRERDAERRRIPPGRKATLKFGIQKELTKRLGL